MSVKSCFQMISAGILLSAPALAVAQQGVTQPVLTPVAPVATPDTKPDTKPEVKPADAALPTPAAGVSPTYVIGADDSIQVIVWKEPTLSGPLAVRPDGKISIPLIGDLMAAGMTPPELSADIATRLKAFVNDPLVTVTVLAVNSKRIFLIGGIAHPGTLALTPGMNVLQAIAVSGGLTPYANSKKIYIQRMSQGKQQKVPFNYRKALKDGDMQGATLMPGDTIVVPE